MKTFYCVATTIHDNGRATIKLVATQQAEQRPENKCTETRQADYYTDWFDSEQEARQFIKGQR